MSYARHDEDWFTFLDRVDDAACERVRCVLNQWFGELPEAKASTIRAELSSRVAAKVEAAFWELYLHAALVRTPLEIQLDVPVDDHGANVDFVVAFPDRSTSRLSMDAVSVGDPPARRARARRLEAAWEALNKAPVEGFYLWVVQVEQEGANPPSGSKLRERVLPWLRTLDRAEVLAVLEASPHQSSLPERSIAVDDWRFLLRAMPLSDDAMRREDPRQRLVGAGPVESAWGGSAAAIRTGLRRKRASKYESLALPYVIALLDLHRFSSGEEDVCSALLGEEAVQLAFREDEIVSTTPIRKHNGYWTRDLNTRVSAVLYARHLNPWTIARVVPQIWINPWAVRPVSARIPWAERIAAGEDGQLERFPPRIEPARLFGLPRDWPGPLFGD